MRKEIDSRVQRARVPFLILMLIILSACIPPSNPPDGITRAENIHVQTVDPVTAAGNHEQFPLPNCGGTGELTQTLGTLASISKSVILGGKATTRAGIEAAIPEAIRLQLELAVEATYQQAYESANARLDTIEMNAAALTHVIYEVQWEKQEFSSMVTYEMDRQIFDTPYTYILNIPKISNSHQIICPTLGVVDPITPIPPTEEVIDTNEIPEQPQAGEPLRPHYQVVVGDGIFVSGTFSDGYAELSEDWLWDHDHRNIQNIRQEEYPSGCDVSRYNTNLLWIGGSPGMTLTINGETIGTYSIAPDPHGYVFEWPVQIGDTMCAVGFASSGFHIILGPDIYYHYDSYCYRGGC